MAAWADGGGAEGRSPPRTPPARAASFHGGGGGGAIEFRVCEPRMALPEYHWVYQVDTRTTLDWPQRAVRATHRFRDFCWLRDELERAHPGAIQLEYRVRALARFLRGVGAHPALCHSAELRGFCELDGARWDAFRQRHAAATRGGAGGGWLRRLSLLSQRAREGYFRVVGPGAGAAGAGAAEAEAHSFVTACSGMSASPRGGAAAGRWREGWRDAVPRAGTGGGYAARKARAAAIAAAVVDASRAPRAQVAARRAAAAAARGEVPPMSQSRQDDRR
eukprot:gene6791-355_t